MEKTDSLLSCKLQYFLQFIWLLSCYFMCNVYFIQRCTMFWHIKNESKNNSQTLPNSLNWIQKCGLWYKWVETYVPKKCILRNAWALTKEASLELVVIPYDVDVLFNYFLLNACLNHLISEVNFKNCFTNYSFRNISFCRHIHSGIELNKVCHVLVTWFAVSVGERGLGVGMPFIISFSPWHGGEKPMWPYPTSPYIFIVISRFFSVLSFISGLLLNSGMTSITF